MVKLKNILLIFADQMHKFALGKISPFVKTPHLDALANRGTLFTACYSNNPICSPFRGILFSGQYAYENGVTDNCGALPTNIPLLAQTLSKAGYETSFIGKWHLGATGNCPVPESLRGGFQHFYGYQCYNDYLDNVCFYDENDVEHRCEQHRESVCTQAALRQLEQFASGGKPFFSVIGYQAPHYPEQPSPAFDLLYQNQEIPFPPDYMSTDPFTRTASPRSAEQLTDCKEYTRYGGDMQEYLRLYYAMVSEIDDGIGQITQKIAELGLEQDTLVLFTSDHGDMQGSRGLKNKRLPYERSCGIPLILRSPGCAEGQLCEAPVSAVDFYPTLLDYAGIPFPPHLRGASLLPFVRGEACAPTPVFAQSDAPLFRENAHRYFWAMLRDEDYKLVVDQKTRQPLLLFHMPNDPFEQNNLVNSEPAVVKRMTNYMLTHFAGAFQQS